MSPTRPDEARRTAMAERALALPRNLLRFQLSLTPPPGHSARERLADTDADADQGAGPGTLLARDGIEVRTVNGWKVTADSYRPTRPGPLPKMLFLPGGGSVLGEGASR